LAIPSLAGALLLLAAQGPADVIHLKNGNWFEGVVIEESGERVVVSTATGEIPLRWDVLERIDRGTEEKNLELSIAAAIKTGNALKALGLVADALETMDSDFPARYMVTNDRDFMAVIRRMPREHSPDVRILLLRISNSNRLTPAGRVQLARLMAELEAPLEASDLMMAAGVGFLASDRDAGTWARSFLNRTIRRLIYENRSTEAVEQLERLRLIDSELADLSAEPMMALARAARARDQQEYELALRLLDEELAVEYPAIAENRTSHVLRHLLRWAEAQNREEVAIEWVARWVEERMPLAALSAEQALISSWASTRMRNGDPASALAIIESLPERQWNGDLEVLWKRARFEADRRTVDERNPADLFQLALWASENDLTDEAINLLERIRQNPILKEPADKLVEQLKHDRDVDILQRAVEAFDEGLMEKVVNICGEMELNPGRESPVQKQAQDLAALARRNILVEQEKRPYIAEAHYQEAERAYHMDRLDEAWKIIDTILTQYAETPAAARAVQLLPEVARALEMELLEGRRFNLPASARVDTVLSTASEDLLGEEIRRMVEMPFGEQNDPAAVPTRN
jgi:hypothetical protein